MTQIEALYDQLHEQCLPGIWSKGVALARAEAVLREQMTDDEIVLRVQVKDRPASPKVTLWPEDEDWFCDCGDKNEICAHVAAGAIALKNGLIREKGAVSSEAKRPAAPFVAYRFKREGRSLSLKRVIVRGDQEEPLQGSLVGLIGGVSSGRVPSSSILTSKEDFVIDALLTPSKPSPGSLSGEGLWPQVFKILQGSTALTLDGSPVRVSAQPPAVRAFVSDATQAGRPGFKIEFAADAAALEVFSNGAGLYPNGVLRPLPSHANAQASFYPLDQTALLASEILPELSKEMPLERQTTQLPHVVDAKPRIVIQLENIGAQILSAVPVIVYGDPPLGQWRGGEFEYLRRDEIPRRDQALERQLARRVQTELHLGLGQVARFEGRAAIDFRMKLEGWELTGRAAPLFESREALEPHATVNESGLWSVEFSGANGKKADPAAVFEAWRAGDEHVPLLGGGFARLPKDWLSKYGERLAALLAARASSGGVLPPQYWPQAVALCKEMDVAVPEVWERLSRALENWDDRFEGIPSMALPKGLKADLRSYQRKGVDWLCFLRSYGLGALLADDMGLGKTLQALCALQGRTLIVCPTSVLQSWAEQIQRFRPDLGFAVFHGARREWDTRAEVVLTSYALLRIEQELLTSEAWDTVILDEAQTIRNPSSQVAQAAHRLRGGFRLALSGTPIENRLDDLWSQFQFLNPGLLGSQADFQERFAAPLARGTSRVAEELRARVRPFILRRLKREVAPELPPRIETVLRCELSSDEREVYETILAATRADVLKQLDEGESVFGALEALLRLRQACCHPALVPGQKAASSAKIDLLLQSLDESIGAGHRALVFSQWTSFLDLIEPHLKRAGISYFRLDGATIDREGVVRAFQAPEGPSVMLLSLKAGGVGITLTAADHVYLLDPWWNPAVENQAADRAHRIGQENSVLIHRLVAGDTIEEKVLDLQKKKQALAGAVLEGAEAAAALTRDDLIALLKDGL